MKKINVIKLFVSLAIVIFIGCIPVKAFAAEVDTPENPVIEESEIYEYDDVEFNNTSYNYYVDSYNVSHEVKSDIRAVASYGWDEGYDGWINSIYIYNPVVKIDGNVVNVARGNSWIGSSIAYVDFAINYSSRYIRVYFSVDEYGDVDFGTVLL